MVDQANIATTLRDLFVRMNDCLLALEEVAARERVAMQLLDAEALMELVAVRRRCHGELQQLEHQGQALMRRQGPAEPLRMEAFIDRYAAEDAEALKNLRRKLYQRLLRMEQRNEDNRLRLRAANDVIEGVLTHLGIKQAATTYGPGGLR